MKFLVIVGDIYFGDRSKGEIGAYVEKMDIAVPFDNLDAAMEYGEMMIKMNHDSYVVCGAYPHTIRFKSQNKLDNGNEVG